MDEKERQVITRVTLALVMWMVLASLVIFGGLYGFLCMIMWSLASMGALFYIIKEARNE